jgi:c(7)-type cytochrome triheme protein
MKKSFGILGAFALIFLLAGAAAHADDEEKVKTSPYPVDITYGQTGMSVVFSHEVHVDTMGYGCADCHEEIFELKAYAAREGGDFVMNAMYQGKFCGHCHDGDTAFDASEFTSCGTCHNGATGGGSVKVVGPEDDLMLGVEGSKARFSHVTHQEMFGCAECHTATFPIKFTQTVTSMDEIYDGRACGSCHNGDFAFGPDDCSACHPDM